MNMKTELINEELMKVKLLMGYDTKKTLTENARVLLNEQPWKVALEDLGKVVAKDSEGALRSLENAFKEGSLDMRNMVTTDGVQLSKMSDVLEAVRLGKLGPAGTGQFSKALFLKGSTMEMRVAGAEAITSMGKFAEKYAGKSREQIVEMLMKDTKYSKADAELLADTYLKKGKGRIKPDPVPDPVPTPPPPVPWNPNIWERIKNLNWKKAVKYLIGAGLIYWLWKYLTSENSPFPECLRGKLSGEDAQKIADSGLDNVLIITKTGNGDIDAAGGGMFYDDGEFKSVNGRYSGDWSGDGPISVNIGGKEYVIECGGTPVPPPIPPTPGNKCKPCSSFPMDKWCKSEKIKDIQGCIGAKPDGCYGPETEGKLKSKGYSTTITQSEYDKIMKDCGKSDTDTDGSTTIVPDTQTGTDV
jgi:hypothetical protein